MSASSCHSAICLPHFTCWEGAVGLEVVVLPQSVKIPYFCSGPISVDPICPQPTPAWLSGPAQPPARRAPMAVDETGRSREARGPRFYGRLVGTKVLDDRLEFGLSDSRSICCPCVPTRAVRRRQGLPNGVRTNRGSGEVNQSLGSPREPPFMGDGDGDDSTSPEAESNQRSWDARSQTFARRGLLPLALATRSPRSTKASEGGLAFRPTRRRRAPFDSLTIFYNSIRFNRFYISFTIHRSHSYFNYTFNRPPTRPGASTRWSRTGATSGRCVDIYIYIYIHTYTL